ncbi:MAG: bifunctional riboflavin kinase/FMN adenylyltransferase, partial [Clostridia bacterium]|nr:bifunctional riboflavin kinase/FMN adenylyltransferase [Clostridia bacterium]
MTKTALALGMFDGMHIGHKKLIDTCVLLAKHAGLEPAVFTFSNHPLELFGARVPRLLTNEERAEIMKRLGVKKLIETEFTKELASLQPAAFVDMLKAETDPGLIVCGFNYTFGKNKAGDAATLAGLCAEKGISCEAVAPVEYGGGP